MVLCLIVVSDCIDLVLGGVVDVVCLFGWLVILVWLLFMLGVGVYL